METNPKPSAFGYICDRLMLLRFNIWKISQNFWHKFWQNFQFWFNKLIKPALFQYMLGNFMNMPISSQKWHFFLKIHKFQMIFLRYQWDFAQSHLVWMAESASTWKRIMNAPVQTSLKEKTAKILRINANFQITNVQVNRKFERNFYFEKILSREVI